MGVIFVRRVIFVRVGNVLVPTTLCAENGNSGISAFHDDSLTLFCQSWLEVKSVNEETWDREKIRTFFVEGYTSGVVHVVTDGN
jgi:hypothetical protein